MQIEIERLPKILVMPCTFLVFLIEVHQKHYPDLSEEGVTSLSGNGFKSTNQKEYLSKEEKYQNL
jgi:hypothetical protein